MHGHRARCVVLLNFIWLPGLFRGLPGLGLDESLAVSMAEPSRAVWVSLQVAREVGEVGLRQPGGGQGALSVDVQIQEIPAGQPFYNRGP